MDRDFWARCGSNSFTFSQTTLKQQNDFLHTYKDKENWRRDDQNNTTLGGKRGGHLITALGDERNATLSQKPRCN